MYFCILIVFYWTKSYAVHLLFSVLGSRSAVGLLKSADVNVVTGLLKLYFRVLPEALFTDAMYPDLVKGMSERMTLLLV